MQDTFLPTNYVLPTSIGGNYYKLKEGDNKFRIIGTSIVGYEYFNEDNKPMRSKAPFINTPGIKPDGKVKEFWAFCVWDYEKSKVKIMQITQSSIKKSIIDFSNDSDFGNPMQYDIKITKKGKGIDTEYLVKALNKVESKKEWFEEARMINLNALYDGGNPFEKQDEMF